MEDLDDEETNNLPGEIIEQMTEDDLSQDDEDEDNDDADDDIEDATNDIDEDVEETNDLINDADDVTNDADEDADDVVNDANQDADDDDDNDVFDEEDVETGSEMTEDCYDTNEETAEEEEYEENNEERQNTPDMDIIQTENQINMHPDDCNNTKSTGSHVTFNQSQASSKIDCSVNEEIVQDTYLAKDSEQPMNKPDITDETTNINSVLSHDNEIGTSPFKPIGASCEHVEVCDDEDSCKEQPEDETIHSDTWNK
jgi:hypothetical protein